MIVDDEFYFREALKISIPWAEYGFEVCGEAKNGQEALEKLELLKPDIALVDINMPIMDGLELIKTMKEKDLGAKAIMLTGYGEFSYAKQAMQFGVKDYILKPINEEELIDSLLRLRKMIESEKNIVLEFEKLKAQVRESLPILKDKLLNNLIQGNEALGTDTEQLKMRLEYLGIAPELASDCCQICVIELDEGDDPRYSQEDVQLFMVSVSNIVQEILKPVFVHEVFNDNAQRICVVLSFGPKNSISLSDAIENGSSIQDSDLDSRLESCFEQILALVKHYVGSTITVGLGNPKTSLQDLPISYKEALVALKNKVILGNGRLIHYSSISEIKLAAKVYTAEHRAQLLMDMRMANTTRGTKLISEIFQEARTRNINRQLLEVLCIEIISTCIEFCAETGHSFAEIFGRNELNILEKLGAMHTLEKIENWTKELIISEITYVEKNKLSRTSKLVDNIKHYIHQNYQEDSLSIDELATHMHINYGYLCYLFKKDMNQTINEYITEFRLKKAKELFDEGNALVSDVANKVGYADANYFGKCFKKCYGVSPSRYIEHTER